MELSSFKYRDKVANKHYHMCLPGYVNQLSIRTAWDRIVTRDVYEVLSNWEEKMYVYEVLSNWEEKIYEEEYIQGNCSPYERHIKLSV